VPIRSKKTKIQLKMNNKDKSSESHFDKIAKDYDFYKKKNWYYYKNLKRVLLGNIPNTENKSVLEIGCGTGDMISSLNPKYGLGTDISIFYVSFFIPTGNQYSCAIIFIGNQTLVFSCYYVLD